MLREATPRDIPRLQEIRGAVRENVLSNPALVTLGDYEAHILGHGRTWVAEVDGEIVGFSSADGERATIWALFIDPAHEARGLGRQLLARAVEWLWSRGAAEIALTTAPGTRAERFYRAAGWTVTGMVGREYRFVLARPPG